MSPTFRRHMHMAHAARARGTAPIPNHLSEVRMVTSSHAIHVYAHDMTHATHAMFADVCGLDS